MSLVMEMESEDPRTFYSLNAADLQQAPVSLSDLITLMGQGARGEE